MSSPNVRTNASCSSRPASPLRSRSRGAHAHVAPQTRIQAREVADLGVRARAMSADAVAREGFRVSRDDRRIGERVPRLERTFRVAIANLDDLRRCSPTRRAPRARPMPTSDSRRRPSRRAPRTRNARSCRTAAHRAPPSDTRWPGVHVHALPVLPMFATRSKRFSRSSSSARRLYAGVLPAQTRSRPQSLPERIELPPSTSTDPRDRARRCGSSRWSRVWPSRRKRA